MRKFAGLPAIPILLSLLVTSPAGAERLAEARGEKLFLWKVTRDQNSVWLLGSIHMAKEELYPLPKEIEEAFRASKVLVVEVDQSKADQAEVQRKVMERGLYPAGESLSTKLSEEQLKNVKSLVEKIGLNMDQVQQMRPWLLALTASIVSLQKLGYDPAQGIDQHFMKEAKEQGKEVKELETVDAQVDLLSGMSEELQSAFIGSTLEELDGLEKRMGQIFELWKKGDDRGLDKLVVEEGLAKRKDMLPFKKKMLDDRNIAMEKKIEGYLKSGEPHFVVVGSAHLVGEPGILELLRKKGYQVEQAERQ
jgi:uncharacterized protein YbaP (TraB family)